MSPIELSWTAKKDINKEMQHQSFSHRAIITDKGYISEVILFPKRFYRLHQIILQYLITFLDGFGHFYWDQRKGLLSSKAQFILDAKLLCHHANANLRSQQSPESPKNLEKSTTSKNDKNSCGAILKTDPARGKLLIDYSSTNLTILSSNSDT